MKKGIIFLLATIFALSLFAEDFTINLYDSYGDGWNGGMLDVSVAGTLVLDDITIDDGDFATFTFAVANGDEVIITYTEGSYAYENSYSVLDNVFTELYVSPSPPDEVYSFIAEIASTAVGVLVGTVTDGTDPIEGATITAGAFSATSAADGSYEIADIFIGNYDVSCAAENYTTAYLNVDITEGNTTTADFALEVFTGDFCETAEAIGEVIDYPFDTTLATTSGFDTHYINQDIWYAYTAAENGTIYVGTCDSAFDTKLAVYGACDVATELGYNDDSCGAQSEISDIEVMAGEDYMIQVGGYGSNSGTGVLDIVFTPAPEPPAVFFSEYIEGSSNNKAIEVYNNSGDVINLDNYRINQSVNGGGWQYQHNFPAGATLADGDVWVIITDQVDPALYDPADADEVLGYPSVVHHNGDDARGLEYTSDGGTTWNLIDVIGIPDEDPGSGWDVAGEPAATQNHTLVRKDAVTTGNLDWVASAGTNADDSEWIVYAEDTFEYLGQHPGNGGTAGPTVAAPDPTQAAENVISLFSNAYTNEPVDTWSAVWDQADVTDVQIAGDDVKLYTNLVFAGIEFTSQTIDVSAMTYFCIDIWTPDPTAAPAVFKIKLVDFGADGAYGGGDDVEHELTFDETTNPALATEQWIHFEIPMSDFAGLTTQEHLAQMIISADPGPNTVYVDNIYFYEDNLTIDPPGFLTAAVDLDDVTLDWWAPGGAGQTGIIEHQNGFDDNGIGLTGGGLFTCAARFSTDDLIPYYGSQLSGVNIRFNLVDSVTSVLLKVWEGGSIGDPGTEIYSEDVTGSIVGDAWSNLTLSAPINLVPGAEYWIGYEIDTIGGHSAGVDAGPMVPDKGGWIALGGSWAQLAGYGLDYNWCIQGVVDSGSRITANMNKKQIYTPSPTRTMSTGKLTVARTTPSRTSRALLSYNIYRDGAVVGTSTVPDTTYLDEDLANGTYEYYVTAVYDEGESGPSNTVTVDIDITTDPPENLFVDEEGYATWDAPGTGGGGMTQIDPQAVDYWTGTTDGATMTETSLIRGMDAEDGWMMFDTSALTAGTTIDSIIFNGYVNDVNWPYWAINGLSVDPLSATPADLLAAIADATNQYNYIAESSGAAAGWRTFALGGNAIADLETAIGQGWFAFGMNSADNSTSYYLVFDGWNEANAPYLEVYSASGERTKLPLAKKKVDNTQSRDFLGYNMYLDGALVEEHVQIEAYQYTGLVEDQTYMAGVTADYDAGESTMSNYEFTYTPPVVLSPPENVMVDEQLGIVSWNAPATPIYTENFDSFTAGDYLGTQSPAWTTWDNSPGTATDAFVVDEDSHSGANSVKVEGTATDLIHLFGDLTEGHYKVAEYMKVGAGAGAYFNLLHEFTEFRSRERTEWALESFFASDGTGYINAAGSNSATFNYPNGEWFQWVVDIDLDNDLAKYYVDGNLVHEWQWSLTATGTPGLNQLGAIDIFASAPTGDTVLQYFDDFEFAEFTTTRELTGYNVYLTDAGTQTQVATNIPDFEFEYENLVEDETYMAGVSAQYDEGESEIIEVEFTYDPVTTFNPPSNFAANVVDFNDVELTWEQPSGSGGEFMHHTGYGANAIGTGAAAEFICAARFDDVELGDFYDTTAITEVKVHIATLTFDYVHIKVYEGGSLGDPGTEVYDADITGDVLEEDWTVHTLSTPVPLVSGNEYWIGYEIHATGDYPASVDMGPMVPDKGAWMYFGGAWDQLTTINPALDYNWCITGVAAPLTDLSAGTEIKLSKKASTSLPTLRSTGTLEAKYQQPRMKAESLVRETRSLSGYKIYKDGVEITEITDPNILTYLDTALDAGDYDYTIEAIYTNPAGVSDPAGPVTATVVLPAPENPDASSAGSNIMVSWDEPTRSLETYNVYRDGDQIATDIANTFYIDPDVPTGYYIYNITAVYSGGYESAMSVDAEIDHVDAGNVLVPTVTELTGNYPNPFNPTTSIKFSLKEAGKVSVNIYNMRGQLVKTLVDDELEAAYHNIEWNGTDDSNKSVSSGVYFYRMTAPDYTSTKKMILMK